MLVVTRKAGRLWPAFFALESCLSRDRTGKPVSTFPDHALVDLVDDSHIGGDNRFSRLQGNGCV